MLDDVLCHSPPTQVSPQLAYPSLLSVVTLDTLLHPPHVSFTSSASKILSYLPYSHSLLSHPLPCEPSIHPSPLTHNSRITPSPHPPFTTHAQLIHHTLSSVLQVISSCSTCATPSPACTPPSSCIAVVTTVASSLLRSPAQPQMEWYEDSQWCVWSDNN